MIDWNGFEQKTEPRRAILDWFYDLLIRAIREFRFERATEAHAVMSKIYAGRQDVNL